MESERIFLDTKHIHLLALGGAPGGLVDACRVHHRRLLKQSFAASDDYSFCQHDSTYTWNAIASECCPIAFIVPETPSDKEVDVLAYNEITLFLLFFASPRNFSISRGQTLEVGMAVTAARDESTNTKVCCSSPNLVKIVVMQQITVAFGFRRVNTVLASVT